MIGGHHVVDSMDKEIQDAMKYHKEIPYYGQKYDAFILKADTLKAVLPILARQRNTIQHGGAPHTNA